MEIGILGKALGGLAMGALLGWFIWRALKQGQQDRALLGGQTAWTKGKADADQAQREAEQAAQGAKDEPVKDPLDW